MRTGTPVPKRDVELKAKGSGPVITYKLPPEELQAKYGPPMAKRPGVRDRLAISDFEKEVKSMSAQPKDGKLGPSKEDFLRQIANGKSINKVEREWGMKPGSLHYWVGKWGLKGIKPDQARQLLDEMMIDGEAEKPVESVDPHRDVAKKLFEAAPVSADLEPAARIIAAEVELHKEKDAEIDQLRKQVDEFASGILSRDREISQLKQALNEIKAERDVLLQTVEKAVDGGHDPVNHPAHYTAGKVECIDAIEAATIGLSGGVAYCTGAAIKYLWRWSRKNGLEDLKKARWYLDRLIGMLEEENKDAS